MVTVLFHSEDGSSRFLQNCNNTLHSSCLPIPHSYTLKMGAAGSSEKLVRICRPITHHHIPEDNSESSLSEFQVLNLRQQLC
jgi:hypothetical protein